MEGLSEKASKILTLIKPYALKTIDDPNTENMIICLILGASEYGKEDETINILENPENFGLGFDSIAEKIYSLFPSIEFVDDDQ